MTSCSWEKWNDYVTREIKIGSLSNFSVKLSIYRSVNMVVSAWWLKTENITFINKSFELSEKFTLSTYKEENLLLFQEFNLYYFQLGAFYYFYLEESWVFWNFAFSTYKDDWVLFQDFLLHFINKSFEFSEKFCSFNLQRRLAAFSRVQLE
jgi:hypothetical protein